MSELESESSRLSLTPKLTSSVLGMNTRAAIRRAREEMASGRVLRGMLVVFPDIFHTMCLRHARAHSKRWC